MKSAGVYVFSVRKDANRLEVKRAIQSVFSVSVKSVNIMIRKSKKKNNRASRKPGFTSSVKRALVCLKEGQKISSLDI